MLIKLKDDIISIAPRNRSLIKSKFRKSSLNRSEETYLSLANTTLNNNTLNHTGHQGSTALNYSSSSASACANSRKSLISGPINFQHIQHIGPNESKSLMSSENSGGLPPLSGTSRLVNISLNESSTFNQNYHPPPKKSQSSSGMRQITKNEISAPTNFRHVVRGLEEFGLAKENVSIKVPSSPTLNKSNISPTSAHQLPNIQAQVKSSSLSSSSSSSSSILHSPNSLNSSVNTSNQNGNMNNNESLAQSIPNTLKTHSVLYNGN